MSIASKFSMCNFQVVTLAEKLGTTRQSSYNYFKEYDAGRYENIPDNYKTVFDLVSKMERPTAERIYDCIGMTTDPEGTYKQVMSRGIISVLRRSAENGDPEATFEYADAICHVAPEEAEQYYRRSSELGYYKAIDRDISQAIAKGNNPTPHIMRALEMEGNPSILRLVMKDSVHLKAADLKKAADMMQSREDNDPEAHVYRAILLCMLVTEAQEDDEILWARTEGLKELRYIRANGIIVEEFKEGTDWTLEAIERLGGIDDALIEDAISLILKGDGSKDSLGKAERLLRLETADGMLRFLNAYADSYSPSEYSTGIVERLMKRLDTYFVVICGYPCPPGVVAEKAKASKSECTLRITVDQMNAFGQVLFKMGIRYWYAARIFFVMSSSMADSAYRLGYMIEKGFGSYQVKRTGSMAGLSYTYPDAISPGSDRTACEWYLIASKEGNKAAEKRLKKLSTEQDLDALRVLGKL